MREPRLCISFFLIPSIFFFSPIFLFHAFLFSLLAGEELGLNALALKSTGGGFGGNWIMSRSDFTVT